MLIAIKDSSGTGGEIFAFSAVWELNLTNLEAATPIFSCSGSILKLRWDRPQAPWLNKTKSGLVSHQGRKLRQPFLYQMGYWRHQVAAEDHVWHSWRLESERREPGQQTFWIQQAQCTKIVSWKVISYGLPALVNGGFCQRKSSVCRILATYKVK